MRIEYEFLETPYGECLAARTARGICHLGYSDRGHAALLGELAQTHPGAELRQGSRWLRDRSGKLFDGNVKLPLDLSGTPFQLRVWRELTRIPYGTKLSYQQLAERVGRPEAVRAVAGAVAANRIAGLVPCHRVIRSDGGLGGYRWGVERKAAMLAAEQAGSDRVSAAA